MIDGQSPLERASAVSRFDTPFDQLRVPREVEGLKASSLPRGSAERVVAGRGAFASLGMTICS